MTKIFTTQDSILNFKNVYSVTFRIIADQKNKNNYIFFVFAADFSSSKSYVSYGFQ